MLVEHIISIITLILSGLFAWDEWVIARRQRQKEK